MVGHWRSFTWKRIESWLVLPGIDDQSHDWAFSYQRFVECQQKTQIFWTIPWWRCQLNSFCYSWYCSQVCRNSFIYWNKYDLGKRNYDFRRCALCTIFMIPLTLWNSVQKNRLLIKLSCFSSDFDETWWNCSTHG